MLYREDIDSPGFNLKKCMNCVKFAMSFIVFVGSSNRGVT